MKARLLAAPALLALACYDYSAPSSVVNGAVVLTQYDQTANFGAYQTFWIDDTVAVVDATGTVTTECSVDGTHLAQTIREQMTARGYTEVVAQTTAHDLEFRMHATLGSQDVYYPGWCSWYPYYYCYPGWTYAGSYSFGTIVIDLGAVGNLPQGSKLPIVWTNANYGVLASYYNGCTGNQNGTNVNWPKIQAAVVRAFDQSPYLRRQ